MSTIDLNNLTGTESLDELDAALEALESGNGGEPDAHSNADGKQAENAASTETDVKTDSSTAAEQQAKTEGGSADKGKADASAQTDTSTEAGKVIASKMGSTSSRTKCWSKSAATNKRCKSRCSNWKGRSRASEVAETAGSQWHFSRCRPGRSQRGAD
ncbi:hypothetical protein PCI56_00955 [Plesiomonas shigelloides subsp. oncorhynchi]|nr:hypothetical protein [Plesiomonas shigelloides]